MLPCLGHGEECIVIANGRYPKTGRRLQSDEVLVSACPRTLTHLSCIHRRYEGIIPVVQYEITSRYFRYHNPPLI